MAIGDGSLAGLARVSYEAVGLADFQNDNRQAETSYRQSTQGMSDAAIKLELSQDKLRRTLQKGPAAYREQARAELQVRQAEEALRKETVQLDRAQDRAQRGLGRFSRGALAGSGAFRSLGRSVAFASAGFLGGAGLVSVMTKSISIASNLEEQQNKVNVTFRNSGKDVIAWSKDSAVSFGIAQDQALEYAGTIGGIFNASGLARGESAKLSRQIVELAADMASFNNASPAEALDALRSGLVGESEPLRRFQVLLTEANVSAEALRQTGKKSAQDLTQGEKIQARYSLILKQTTDQQGDFKRTSDGLANSQRQLSALWREAEGIVGQALLPSVTNVVHGLRDWLKEDENRESLQRNVNTLVKDGAKVAGDLADVIDRIAKVTGPAVKAVGGLGRAVEIAAGVWVLFKARSLLGFGATAAASRVTSARMVADAAVAGRAWDIATRPRTLVVTETYTGGGGPGGTPGGYVGSRGRGGTPGRFGRLGGLALGAAGVLIYGAGGIPDTQSKDSYYRDRFATWMKLAREGKLTDDAYAEIAPHLTEEQQGKLTKARGSGIGGYDEGKVPGRTPGAQAPPRRRGGAGGGGRTIADIILDQARAEGTASKADDVRLHRELRDRYQKQIDALEARGHLNAKQKALLTDLYNKRNAEQAALDSIAAEGEAKIIARRKAAAAKRAAMMEQGEKELENLNKSSAARAARQRARTNAILAASGKEQAAKKKAAKDAADKPLTAAELQRMQFDFLTRLTGDIAEWGSNFQSDSDTGQIATQAHVQTDLMRRQNSHLERLIEGNWHAGAQLASAELSAAGWGVGF